MITHQHIISSFAQHGFGNCTSIGVIKAAIEVWGITRIWEAKEQAGVTTFLLRNGRNVSLSVEELSLARDNSGFQLLVDTPTNRDIVSCACICFAVICKSKQEFEEYDSLAEAIEDVNSGENATDAPRYLGLDKHQEYISYRQCFAVGGVVAHSLKHTVYVSHGDYDDYGRVNRLDSIREWMRFARKMYRFRSD